MDIPVRQNGEQVRVPIEQAPERDLQWWAENGKRDDIRNACAAELRRRSNGGAVAAPKPPPNNDEARQAIQVYSGAHDDAAKATAALQKLQDVGHLVSPAPACGALPAGTAMVVSAVIVDSANETFGLPDGKRGLGKVPLCKIAGALGVSWSPESGRLDDGSDPRFVHFRAIGYIREFDGTLRRISGEKIMDLRPGSAQVEAHEKRARDKWEREKAKNPDARMGDWESQIRDMRLFILEHAETKAQLRAIRSLGLRSSYSVDELHKPFFAAKLQFTGHSDDPEIRRMFAERIADSMLGATKALYGAAVERPEVTRPQQQAGYAPPPVETTGHVVDDADGPDGVPSDDDNFPT